jgi:hypothetical protein
MSASKETSASWTLTAMVFTTAVVITAAATHHLTKRNEQQQQNALVWKQYQREKLLHEKTAAARKAAREPSSGSLIEDVIVDKIYLWECQDLCKHFPSADVENTMKNLFLVKRSPIQSPMLRIMTSDDLKTISASHHSTPYIKLITNHECVLASIVRKPNMSTHTVAYVRAGPRRYIHFDPLTVNAAIVTCGGLYVVKQYSLAAAV